MPKRVLGIDIGTHSVKFVQLQGTLKGYTVSSLLEHRWERDNALPPSSAEIASTLKALFAREKMKPGTIVSALPAQAAIIRTLALPFRDLKKIREVVRYELEAHIPYPVEEMLVDFLVLERREKETVILVAAVSKEVVAGHLAMLREAGIDPEIVELELFADINTYLSLHKPSEEKAVALLNIGASKMTLKVLQGTRLLFARAIPKGANIITETIQKEGKFASFAEAEQQKITDGESPELFPLIQSALVNLVKEVEYTLFSYMEKMGEQGDIQEILLSGGGANTPGILECFAQHFDVPVHRMGKDERLSLLFAQTPPLSAPFTVALGLGIRGWNRSIPGMNFRQEEFSFHRSYEEIKGKLILAGVMLLLALGLQLGNFYYRLAQKEGQYQQMRDRVQALFRQTFPDVRNVVDPLQQARQKIQEEENKLKAFGGITGAQLSSLELLRELSEKIPSTIKIDVFDLLISHESINMSAQTNSFDSVDNLKKSLETSSYFESVKVTNAKVGLDENTVEFKLSITLKKL